MNSIQVFINTLAAQARLAARETIFSIKVTHQTERELVVTEELRRKKVKSLQRKNKRNRRRMK
jgi:hypothetical protein